MAIRVNFTLSEQKTDQNISKKQNQNSLLVSLIVCLLRMIFISPLTDPELIYP